MENSTDSHTVTGMSLPPRKRQLPTAKNACRLTVISVGLVAAFLYLTLVIFGWDFPEKKSQVQFVAVPCSGGSSNPTNSRSKIAGSDQLQTSLTDAFLSEDSDPLTRQFASHKGRLVWKWTHYLSLYHRHFAKFRGQKINILEIGIFKGGSLQFWKKYFGPQATIYGLDVNPAVKVYEEPNIHIFIGDQANKTFLEDLRSKLPPLDILIDDGGHRMDQQKATFEVLFPHVKNHGGVYWAEDLHTSYYKADGGGYKDPNSFVEYTKNWIDQLNAHYAQKTGDIKPNSFTENARGIHFYDSIVVIEKQPRRNALQVMNGGSYKQPFFIIPSI